MKIWTAKDTAWFIGLLLVSAVLGCSHTVVVTPPPPVVVNPAFVLFAWHETTVPCPSTAYMCVDHYDLVDSTTGQAIATIDGTKTSYTTSVMVSTTDSYALTAIGKAQDGTFWNSGRVLTVVAQ
jgi:hypothetical protein